MNKCLCGEQTTTYDDMFGFLCDNCQPKGRKLTDKEIAAVIGQLKEGV
jgi:hypothetical protein